MTEVSAAWRWDFHIDAGTFMLMSPWFIVILACDGFDCAYKEIWSGIQFLYGRNPEYREGSPLFVKEWSRIFSRRSARA